MKRRELLRAALFTLLAAALLVGAWRIFDRKTVCYYTEKVRGFYNEPEQTMDVLAFGSSRMYCTLDPLVLHQETGLRAYVLATQQQPLRATWYYMQEAFARQRPRLVILEPTMAFKTLDEISDAALRDCLDPLPWSKNKRDLIRDTVPAGQRSSYYFNFLKYHQRWKELGEQDFDFSYLDKRDPFRGYMYLTPERGADCRRQSYDKVEAEPLPEENLRQLREIAALVKENGASLLFLVPPYEVVTDDLGLLKSLHAFCDREGIPFLDLNLEYDALGLDEARDFFDTGHFNVHGSEKASSCIAAYIKTHFDLPPVPNEALDREIAENYEIWVASLHTP